MPDNPPTWDEDVKDFFTLADIGCMIMVNANPRLDLDDYESVRDYILASEDNRTKILDLLRTGRMPKGGPKWDEDTFNTFSAWVEADCPKSTPVVEED